MATSKTVKSNQPRAYSGWRPPWLIFVYEAYQHRIIRPKHADKKPAHRYELHRIPLHEQKKNVVQQDHVCNDCAEKKALAHREQSIPSWLSETSHFDAAKSVRPPWSTPLLKHMHLSSPATHLPPHNHQLHHYSSQHRPSDEIEDFDESSADHVIEETNRVTGRIYTPLNRPYMHSFAHGHRPQPPDNRMPPVQYCMSPNPLTNPTHSRSKASRWLHHAEHVSRVPQSPNLQPGHTHDHGPLHHLDSPASAFRSLHRADHNAQPIRPHCHLHHNNHDNPVPAEHQNQHQRGAPHGPTSAISEPAPRRLRRGSQVPPKHHRCSRH